MEETLSTHSPGETNNSCIQCGSGDIARGYPNALCHPCRKNLIKYPIPLWVKLFGATVMVIILTSLISFPTQLSTGIHLKRAEKAIANRNFRTAQKELMKVIEVSPNSVETKANLAIASFYNMDLGTFGEAVSYLEGKQFEDAELLQKLELVLEKARQYYPSDSFNIFLDQAGLADTVSLNQLQMFVESHPEDLCAKEKYAERLFALEDPRTDSMVTLILASSPDYTPALIIKTMRYRSAGKLDSALEVCNSLLDINKEQVTGMSVKARILLAQGKVTEGLKQAQKAVEINSDDPYTQASLALAYHLNRDYKRRDDLIRHASQDSASAYYMKYVKDIVTGKEKFPQ